MSEWQPIETAPKDGTEVWLSGYEYNNQGNPRWVDAGYFRDGFWWDCYGADIMHPPTHWMEKEQPPNPPADLFASEQHEEVPVADAGGWIPWDGEGECPIPDAKAGEYHVRFRNDDGSGMYARYDAKHLEWHNNEQCPDGDIIAYRIVGGGE